jgi:hypothetical protein
VRHRRPTTARRRGSCSTYARTPPRSTQ